MKCNCRDRKNSIIVFFFKVCFFIVYFFMLRESIFILGKYIIRERGIFEIVFFRVVNYSFIKYG